PDLGAGADFAVVEGIGTFARTGHGGHFLGAAAPRQVLAHQAHEIALALDDVHGDLFFGEAVVLVGQPEMQLADGHNLVPAFTQHMVPAGYGAIVGIRVVPEADLVDVLAAGKARARGDTDRTGGIGAGKARA